MGNYAFIDGINVHLGVRDEGWEIDYKKFRTYLRDKYNVIKAYYFMGYVKSNKGLYDYLENAGYELIFKETMKNSDGEIKGNCDAELVLHAMLKYEEYEKAVIVTSDGDFTCLANHLQKEDKLRILIAPSVNSCSILLKKNIKHISYMDDLKHKIGR